MCGKIFLLFLLYFLQLSKAFNIVKWIQAKEENEGYDRFMPPGQSKKQTTDVQIQVYVESIGNFRASTMDYDLDMYFVEFWSDPRLTHTESDQLVINDRDIIKRLWLPDIYFANSKSAHLNDVTVPNCALKIAQNGSIRYSVRVSLKLSCHMNLKGYPMDKQVCYVKIVTYGNTIEKVNVTWSNQKPIELDGAIGEADMKIDRTKTKSEYCDGHYFGLKFSCLRADFYLKRYIEYSLLRTYVPSVIIVTISWISFWVDPASVPGRVCLAITTLLTLFTQAIATHFHMPPVRYATGQDVWFGVCIFFQFITLVEFAVVNYFTRKSEEALNKKTFSDAMVVTMLRMFGQGDPEQDEKAVNIKRQQLAQEYKKTAADIDRISRFLSPLAFGVFCIVYWSYYLHFINTLE